MATRFFNATVFGEGSYLSNNWISGSTINSKWLIHNVDSNNRSLWGVNADGWLEYRSAFSTYAGRYSETDANLKDTTFETDIVPAGNGNFEIGFFFRFIDRFSYYYVTYNGGWRNWNGNNIRLVKVSGTNHLVQKEYAIAPWIRDTQYTFKCELKGNNVKVYLNNTLIFDYTDMSNNQYLKGAFGPFVLGQEYAKWRGFRADNLNTFSVSEQLTNERVDTEHNSIEAAKLLRAEDVGTLLEDERRAVMTGLSVKSYEWSSFRISSSDPNVYVVFDKVPSQTITTTPTSKLYAYQNVLVTPPVAPTDLMATPIDSNNVRLTWRHSGDDEDGFQVLDENDNILATLGVNVQQWVETGLTENTTYRRKVRAFNAAGYSDETPLVVFTTPRTVPVVPTNFQGVPLSDKEIEWTWVDESTNEDGFEVISFDEVGNPVVLATLPADTTIWKETGLKAGTTYTRAVRAVNSVGVSPRSNIYSVMTKEALPEPPKVAPVNFYGIALSKTSIYWFWQDVTNNETGFELLDQNDRVVATLDANTTSYTEEGLFPGFTYLRKIRAFNSSGYGPSTALFSVQTMPDEGEEDPLKPAPVTDLSVEVHSPQSATLTWVYNYDEEESGEPLGFKVYAADGRMLVSVPYTPNGLTIMEAAIDFYTYTFNNLQPDTTYRMFVVAYNAMGEGTASNTVTFVTPNIVPEIEKPPVEPLEDPLDYLVYDRETIETGRIKAFQSGIGDRLDLKVANLFSPSASIEQFSYQLYIKAKYDRYIMNYHDGIPARFRITTEGIYENSGLRYSNTTPWKDIVINGADTEDGVKQVTIPINADIPNGIINLLYRVEVTGEDGIPIQPYNPEYNKDGLIKWALSFSSSDTTNNQYDSIQFWSDYTISKRVVETWKTGVIEGPVLEVSGDSFSYFSKYIYKANHHEGYHDGLYDYQLVITSTNPNVEIMLTKELTDNDFILSAGDGTNFLEVKMKARIINKTQTLWYPSIHSGYYYLNQEEHFLYVDDKVKPMEGDIDETYTFQFPYKIVAYGRRWHESEEISFVDTDKADFLQGELTEGITLDMYSGSISLTDEAKKATFVSRVFRFGRPVSDWGNIDWTMNEKAIADGAKLKVEMARCDELGNIIEEWHEQTNHEAVNLPTLDGQNREARQVRYRLTLEEGHRRDDFVDDREQNEFLLNVAYREHVMVVGNAIMIDNVNINQEGLFISDPINIGKNVQTLGKLRVTTDVPAGSELRIYSVTVADPAEVYDKAKWVRATTLVSQSGNTYTYQLQSSYRDANGNVDRPWLSIVFEFVRSTVDNDVPITLSPSTFDEARATNLQIINDGIQLIDENKRGMYESGNIYVGNVQDWRNVITAFIDDVPDNRIVVETVTGDTEEDLVNRANIASEWLEAGGGIIASTPRQWLKYRVYVYPGKINRRDTIFKDDRDTEWATHAERANMEITPEGTIRLSNVRQNGFYRSEEFNLGFQDKIKDFKITADQLSSIKIFVTQKVDGLWKPEKEYFITSDGRITIDQYPSSHLQYRLEVAPYTKQEAIADLYSESMLETGVDVSPNLIIGSNGSIALKDGVANERYESRTYSSADIVRFKSMKADVYQPFDTKVILEIATSDTDKDWDAQTWVQPDDSGNITINKRSFYRFRITLVSGKDLDMNWIGPTIQNFTLSYDANVYHSPVIDSVVFTTSEYDNKTPLIESITVNPKVRQNFSPVVSDIHIMPELFKYVRVAPVFHDIVFTGHIEGGYGVENYSVPMIGEIIADGKERAVTAMTTEEIVRKYLADNQIDNSNNVSFTDYLLSWDSAVYPVELYTSITGNEVVRARTVGEIDGKLLEVLYKNIRIYFDHETMGVVVRPVPQVGSPIIVKNSAGQPLTQVHFRDAHGESTLTNIEEFKTDSSRYLFLAYRDVDVTTLNVLVYQNGDWKKLDDCKVKENRLILPYLLSEGTPVRVSYKIKNSFVVNWNHSPQNDYALIQVNTVFDRNDKDTRLLDIKYEVEKNTAYYLAKEINLNPLKTQTNAGFIYLSDMVYPPYKIEVNFNPNIVYKNRADQVTINARVLDEFGNPCVGYKVRFTTTVGNVYTMKNGYSDENGVVTGIFSSDGIRDSTAEKAVITITEDSTGIQRQVEIFLVEEQDFHKLAVIAEKNAVANQDVVKLKVIAMGANYERIPNKTVQISVMKDRTTPVFDVTGRTNVNGEFYAYYQHDKELTKGTDYLVVLAEASNGGTQLIQEQILLNVSGV